VGTASWTDPTIIKSGWYPSEARTAEQRLGYYAAHFPLVEVDSSYYALPSEQNSVLWVERTPPDFTFNIKAFALLTGHGTAYSRLPAIIRDSLPADFAEGKRQIYMKGLPEEAQQWIWDTFEGALDPLRQAGKLGAILFQFPPWFHISRSSKEYLERCRQELPHDRLAVEFRNASWLSERNAAETLSFLADHDLTYVCVDEPQGFRSSVPLVTAVTDPDLAMLRLHGRNAENWEKRGTTVTERFKYLYGDEELKDLAPRVKELASEAKETHVLFNNCYSDFGVRNAARLADLVDAIKPT
jgi:uncharacterized protein YecE (DUF72 family)